MEMKVIQSRRQLCTCCMEEHEVKTVCVTEHTCFKDVQLKYEAVYFYCDMAEEFYMDELQMRENDTAMKDAYRKEEGLLTSKEIIGIREKYHVSQRDFCLLLGWGGKTITRYEGHQVQDKAHDSILKKIDKDPEWFLNLLTESRAKLPIELYKKYYDMATSLYEKNQDLYLRKAIEARYAKFQNASLFNGNVTLSLDKTVDVIRYLASSKKVTNLYKVKLMKLMWYADALSFKKRGYAITGLVYQAMPMGAVPIGHDSIIDLKGVPCEEVDMGEAYAYHFQLKENKEKSLLSSEDREILEIVTEKIGGMSKNEIVAFMHQEEAYRKTLPHDIISFKYAESLRI